jgi:hypothetical protein
MATIAALGKASAGPAISAGLFRQDCFYVRKSQFSWSPKFYFYDEHGNTLAFVRNATFSWNKQIRVFTDPTLSFELLAIRPLARRKPGESFAVIDSVNHKPVGAIRQVQANGPQRRQWALMDSDDREVATVIEDSLLLSGIRRLVTELVPQSYTFTFAGREVGRATQNGSLFTPEMKIDLSGDCEKELDRRLVAATVVFLLAFSGQPLGAE